MCAQDLIDRLLALPDVAAQRQMLRTHSTQLNDRVADALKQQADHFLRADIHRSLDTAELLLYVAELDGNPMYRALGLLAKANAHAIGLGEHRHAIELYDEAAAIYQGHDQLVDQAKSQIGKLWALASLGRYEEVMEIGDWASRVLESQGEWLHRAKLMGNMGAISGRIGDDTRALSLFDETRELYLKHGAEAGDIAGAEYNRAIVLRNLGRLDESIRASRVAIRLVSQTDEPIRLARAQQSLATTYYVLGRYNEVLELLESAKGIFLADGRQRDALLAELFVSDCLLQLRRYTDVLEKCRQIRQLFSKLGTRFELAQAILSEAVAYAGLGRYEQSQESLAEARHIFAEDGNPVWVATTDLEQANIHYRQQSFRKSRVTAERCAVVFQKHNLPFQQARANIIAARAAAALREHDRALQLVHEVLAVGENDDIPSLTYQSRYLLAGLARHGIGNETALVEYERAVKELERLRGRLMVEYRADFLADKQVIYEDVVDLCLEMNRPARALGFAERAKSQALLDLLAYRLDLRIQPRTEDDRALVAEILDLRARRDQMYRRWEGDEETRESSLFSTRESHRQVQHEILAIEKRITDLWHKLLVRNADYAREASLWHVRTEPIRTYLDPDCALVEYYFVRGRIVAFIVTADEIHARWMPGDTSQVQRLTQLLYLNLRSVPNNSSGQMSHLITNFQVVSNKIYQLLVEPLFKNLSAHTQLIIVPHGFLHYLPFHALHNGEEYLLERFNISYLPGASLLRYCREVRPVSRGLLAVGNSCSGRLPHAVQETEQIVRVMNGRSLLEDQTTIANFTASAPDYGIIHLASHGEFRSDNPLFSSLTLADGWLTTLDIFSLRLNASLVTLSGCQTGRSVVGGGDELLGLMRAFLYAGAASLVLSLWPVEDRSTAQLMQTFYQRLAGGWEKAPALRQAQLDFLRADHDSEPGSRVNYHHPYFWASFNLVGDAGAL